MNTSENNKLISIFDGQDHNLGLDYLCWERIMPLWFKILDTQKTPLVKVEVCRVYIYLEFEIHVDSDNWESKIFYNNKLENKSMLEVYYKTIVEFITWYNNK